MKKYTREELKTMEAQYATLGYKIAEAKNQFEHENTNARLETLAAAWNDILCGNYMCKDGTNDFEVIYVSKVLSVVEDSWGGTVRGLKMYIAGINITINEGEVRYFVYSKRGVQGCIPLNLDGWMSIFIDGCTPLHSEEGKYTYTLCKDASVDGMRRIIDATISKQLDVVYKNATSAANDAFDRLKVSVGDVFLPNNAVERSIKDKYEYLAKIGNWYKEEGNEQKPDTDSGTVEKT